MALIRRSPRNISRAGGVYSATPVAPTTTKPGNITANPYLPGKSPTEQQDLAKRTMYLQPTAQELTRAQFGQFGTGITSEQYISQTTSLSAATYIGQQTGVQTAASDPRKDFAQFRRDIELEEMFGMWGSGSAANIRLAQAQTGAPIEKLIAAENKRLGIRQEQAVGKAAFQYQNRLFDKEGNLVSSTNVPTSAAVQSPVSIRSGVAGQGITNVSIISGPGAASYGAPSVSPTIAPAAAAPAPINIQGPKTLDVKSLKTFQAKTPITPPKTIKPVIDLGVAIREGREAAMRYPSYLKELTPPGSLRGGKLEGLTYESLYEKKPSGELTLTKSGESYRNLILGGTPSLNIRLR